VARSEPIEPIEIFRAGSQVVMVRLVQALLVLIATPGLLWAAWARVAIPDPTLAPLARYALVAVIVGIAAAASIGIWVYGWCGVTSATWDPRARACHITLAGLFVPTRLTLAACERGRYHAGTEPRLWIRGERPLVQRPRPRPRLPADLGRAGRVPPPRWGLSRSALSSTNR
jgi:hypothetical protein